MRGSSGVYIATGSYQYTATFAKDGTVTARSSSSGSSNTFSIVGYHYTTAEELMQGLQQIQATAATLQEENTMLKQCLLEMSETVYA